MILRRIKVQGVRCFRSPVELGPFSDGINIVFAPNESGKSTLVEAVARALFDRYSVRSEKVEVMRPWGTSLSPQIELDFDVQGKNYRLLKRFLDDQQSQLFELGDSGPDLLHERDKADDFLRELMVSEVPGRGASNPKHWGVARMLWCLQSPGNDQCIDVPDAVAQQLRRALPNCAIPGQTSLAAILARIDARYGKFYTDTGRAKKGSPLIECEQEITQLIAQYDKARETYETAQQAAADMARVEAELVALEQETTEHQAKVDELKDAVKRLTVLRTTTELLGKDVEQAQKEYDAVAGAKSRFEEAVTSLGTAKSHLERLARERDQAAIARKAAEVLLGEARKAHEVAEAARRKIDTERQYGRKVNDTLSLIHILDGLAEKMATLTDLSQELQRLEQQLNGTPCPSADELSNVRNLTTQVASLQAQLMAIGLTAVVETEVEHLIELQDAQATPIALQMRAGTVETFQAGTSVEIRVPGVVRISVTSGSAEPVVLSKELAQVHARIQEIFSRYGAMDETCLAMKREIWQGFEREVLALRKEIVAHAAPYANASAVGDAVTETRRELTIRCNQLGIDVDEARQLASVDVDALESSYAAADAKVEKYSLQLEARMTQFEQSREKEEASAVQMQSKEADVTKHDAEMKAALKSMGCRDSEELASLVATRALELQACIEKLKTVTAQLPSPGMGPEEQLQTALAAIKDIAARAHTLESQQIRFRVEVEHAQIEGRYEHLSEIEEKLIVKREQFSKRQQDAQAIKLLRQMILTCREKMTEGQLPEVENAVSRMLQAITGKPRAVAMASDFTVESVMDDRMQGVHHLDDLSAGAREQLDLVMRIALGEAYAREYGQTMMVLDDALLYTDPVRHDRVKEIIKIAAQHLQIFIFTSHPERYRGITPPEYQLDLVQLATSAR